MRSGFTKTEILVVTACLIVLLGLLLPAINSAPGTGRRLSCQARLGRLAQAIAMYENAKNQFPGHLNALAEDKEHAVKVGTWAVTLLPYVDQESLYDLWADPSTTVHWNRRGGASSRMNGSFFPELKLFTCPNDANLGDSPTSCSFAVNAGFFPDPSPESYKALSVHEQARHSSRPANGVFSNQLPAEITCAYTRDVRQHVLGSRADAPTRRSDIRDGLSMTIAISESRNADSWARVGHDGAWTTVEIDGVTYAGDDLDSTWSPRLRTGVVWQYKAQPSVEGVADYIVPKLPAASRTRRFAPDLARPSSFHPEMFHVAMLGGSVQGVSTAVDYRVLQALLTPDGKQSDAPDRGYVLSVTDLDP